MTHTVTVVPYDPNWPTLFEQERALIFEALGQNCIEIHHIGSTSIPNLSAKPILDILPVVKNILDVDVCIDKMEKLGYQSKGEAGVAFRRHFFKGKNIRTHNVHIYEKGDPEIERYLRFRNWIRSHPDDARRYESLKKQLAKRCLSDLLSYNEGKEPFISEIDRKDGYSGWRMVKALTQKEWDAVELLRLEAKEHSAPLSLSPFDTHFVFYKNTEVVGYAHLEDKGSSLCLKTFVISLSHQRSGWGSLFLKLLQKWVFQQGIEILTLPSFPFFEQRKNFTP